jgi:hypothetical protein
MIGSAERVYCLTRIDLDGRFMLPSKEEHSCTVLEMSTGQMRVSSDAKPALGEQVIVYIAELGRFEGKVERHEEGGFAVCMKLTDTKSKKLAQQLAWFANRDTLHLEDNRRHKRIVPLNQLTTVRFSNGKEHIARINDISASGVSVEVNLSLAAKVTVLAGSSVFIGKKAAKVSRIFDGGFAARFDETFEADSIDETVVL